MLMILASYNFYTVILSIAGHDLFMAETVSIIGHYNCTYDFCDKINLQKT